MIIKNVFQQIGNNKSSLIVTFYCKNIKSYQVSVLSFLILKGKYHFKAENHSKGKSECCVRNVIVFKHFKQNFIMLMASKNVLLCLVCYFPARQVNGENKMYNTAASYLISLVAHDGSQFVIPFNQCPSCFFVQPGDSCLSWEVLFCEGFLQTLHSNPRLHGFVLG